MAITFKQIKGEGFSISKNWAEGGWKLLCSNTYSGVRLGAEFILFIRKDGSAIETLLGDEQKRFSSYKKFTNYIKEVRETYPVRQREYFMYDVIGRKDFSLELRIIDFMDGLGFTMKGYGDVYVKDAGDDELGDEINIHINIKDSKVLVRHFTNQSTWIESVSNKDFDGVKSAVASVLYSINLTRLVSHLKLFESLSKINTKMSDVSLKSISPIGSNVVESKAAIKETLEKLLKTL